MRERGSLDPGVWINTALLSVRNLCLVLQLYSSCRLQLYSWRRRLGSFHTVGFFCGKWEVGSPAHFPVAVPYKAIFLGFRTGIG